VGKYILRRLLQMIPVVLGATLLLFWLNYSLPSDPAAGRCGERACSPAYVEAFRAEYNLDKPFLVQYLTYLWRLLHGDFGNSFMANSPVTHQLAIRYPTTIKLAIIALLFEAVVGIALGIIAGMKKGKLADNLVILMTLIFISVPVFVVGGLAQLFFGIKLHWFPVTSGKGGWYDLLLPGLVLGALSLAYTARLTRTSLVENLRSDYVRTAKAKGLSTYRVVGIHTLRNSLLPVVTYIGASFGGLMGGAIVTERIFNVNGIGFFIYTAISQHDGNAMVGSIVLLVLIYLFMNLLVDVLYGVLDPRISHG